MATMTINLPNRPKGSKVEVDGLGEFVNGETVELTDEQLDNFEQQQGKSFGEAFKNAYGFEFEGIEFPPDEVDDEEEQATPTPTNQSTTGGSAQAVATTPTTSAQTATTQTSQPKTSSADDEEEGDK